MCEEVDDIPAIVGCSMYCTESSNLSTAHWMIVVVVRMRWRAEGIRSAPLTECEYDPGGPRKATLGGGELYMDFPRARRSGCDCVLLNARARERTPEVEEVEAGSEAGRSQLAYMTGWAWLAGQRVSLVVVGG